MASVRLRSLTFRDPIATMGTEVCASPTQTRAALRSGCNARNSRGSRTSSPANCVFQQQNADSDTTYLRPISAYHRAALSLTKRLEKLLGA